MNDLTQTGMSHPHELLAHWYNDNIARYQSLTTTIQQELQDLISRNNIDYLNLTSRTKSLKSLIEKVKRKKYVNPSIDNTDLSGIRIVTYIESDVRKICDLIAKVFRIHPDKSIDKTDALDVDQVGYRSVHFVCDIGTSAYYLERFPHFQEMLFEIQVRTALQHAWAEIHYSRDYKFTGVLPRHISRRLYCLAGTLELVDLHFTSLAHDIEEYGDEVVMKVSDGDFDVEINTTSLLKYLPFRLAELETKGVKVLSDNHVSRTIIAELRNFGISTLADLHKLFSEEFFQAVASHQPYTTYTGALRDSMLFADIERYFKLCWNNGWPEAESYTFEVLKEKYSEQTLEQIFRERNIQWN